MRIRFVKKRGDLARWYEIFNDMKTAVLDEILLAPENYNAETVSTLEDSS